MLCNVKTREEIQKIVLAAKKAKAKVGFISGVFDLFHNTHLEFIVEARKYCDLLIIGVNSDASVRMNKNPKRPIINEQHRANILAALDYVDYVFIFTEATNNKNIEVLEPDIYMKGSDYRDKTLTSQALVESYGGEVKLIGALDYGTTEIIEEIIRRYK